MRTIGLLSILLLIQACATTPVVWTKADADTTDVEADIRDCRQLAADEAWRLGWERRWPPSFYDPLFMPPFYRWSMPFWYEFPDSIERQHALEDFCMHSKGYRLEAIPHEP